MIEAFRGWLTGVIAASFLVAMAQSLIPEGTVRKVGSFVGGLALLLTLTKPILGADFWETEFQYSAYAAEIEQRQTELQSQSEQSLTTLIAQRTQAYILDKAAELGVDCAVQVLMEPGEDGTPRPAGAELTGERSEALGDYMEQELGIPRERQVYREAE